MGLSPTPTPAPKRDNGFPLTAPWLAQARLTRRKHTDPPSSCSRTSGSDTNRPPCGWDTPQAMPNDRVITHAEALRLIDEQIGEKVYLALLVTPGDPEDPENPLPVFHMIAPLRNPLAPKPPRLEAERGFYEVGNLHFLFAPMTGTIHLRDNGVDFRVDRTCPSGSRGTGAKRWAIGGPIPSLSRWLNAVGIRLPEHEPQRTM